VLCERNEFHLTKRWSVFGLIVILFNKGTTRVLRLLEPLETKMKMSSFYLSQVCSVLIKFHTLLFRHSSQSCHIYMTISSVFWTVYVIFLTPLGFPTFTLHQVRTVCVFYKYDDAVSVDLLLETIEGSKRQNLTKLTYKISSHIFTPLSFYGHFSSQTIKLKLKNIPKV
jgi:hypothetical protein